MNRSFFVVVGIAFPLLCSSTLLADADAAKGYVKEAQGLIEQNDLEGAGSKLELAETELDGVDAAAKEPIEASIKATRQKIADATAAVNKPKYQRMLDDDMREAEEAIGNLATWPGAEDRFKELTQNAEAKAVIGPELEAAAKKFATFKKLHTKKAAVILAGYAEDAVKQAEDQWTEAKPDIVKADTSPEAKEAAIEKTGRYVTDAREKIKQLPEDDSHVKPLSDRLDKVAVEYTKLALADKVKEELDTLKRQYELYKDDWDGYEKETAGPTWDQYSKQSSGPMSAFLAPKTREFISRMDGFLIELDHDDNYQAVQSDDTVKAYVANVKKKRDAAYAKMLKLVTPVVDAAEKAQVKDPSDLDRLKDDVRLALGEKSAEGLAMQARLEKKVHAHAAAATGADEAKTKLVEMLRGKAEAEWPELHKSIDAQADADLSNPAKLTGKNISFQADNLMGYRFKPGDFYYATTLGGVPVAAKIDPQLMNQIKATEKAIGRSLGDDDGDGKWDVIATVTDRKTKLLAKREVKATGTVDGADVKVSGEYAEPVDAVVIEIIAAKCGPFAGAKGHGVLKEDGTIAK